MNFNSCYPFNGVVKILERVTTYELGSEMGTDEVAVRPFGMGTAEQGEEP